MGESVASTIRLTVGRHVQAVIAHSSLWPPHHDRSATPLNPTGPSCACRLEASSVVEDRAGWVDLVLVKD